MKKSITGLICYNCGNEYSISLSALHERKNIKRGDVK